MADRRELIDDPEEAWRVAFDGSQAKIWTTLPAVVESYDPVAQTISAQPAIQGIVSDERGRDQYVDMPLCVDVPVMFPKGGGFAITHPISPGDECLLSFSARCIDSWWQSGSIQPPLELRMHDLSDGFAFFAPTSQPKRLADVQTDGVEIRTYDRSTYFKLTEGTIFIKGNIVHEGNTDQVGNTTVTGTVTGDVVKTTIGVGLGTHDHGAGAIISGKTPPPNAV